jgi:magnesium-transporting ATPase (P-type)
MVVTVEGTHYLFAKGAPERLMPKCSHVLTSKGEVTYNVSREDEIMYVLSASLSLCLSVSISRALNPHCSTCLCGFANR